jgi:beta-lactamase regulating signal transducer with metallopeptidase domain
MSDTYFWTILGGFNAEFSLRLTWAIAHFLWQGCAIAMCYAVAAWCLKRRAAHTRYVAGVAALLLMAACLPVTFLFSATGVLAVEAALPNSLEAYAPVEVNTLALPEQSFWESETDRANALFSRAAPYASACYLCGAALMLMRVLVGLWGGQRLRRSSEPVRDDAILAMAREQAARLRLRIVPIVACSRHVSAPVVVGIWRPMILLPAVLLAGLTPDQLQAVLIHELAHIRRYDLAVNVAQRVIEALLFFHPAVWWLSRCVSLEREQACDDFVLHCGWQRVSYAETLIRTAELGVATRHSLVARATALAATGKDTPQFKRRIMRLLGEKERPQLRVTRSGAVLLVALTALAAIAPVLPWPSIANSLADDEVSTELEAASEPLGEPSKAESAVVKAARQGFEAARAAYETDTLPLETLCQWSERLLSAEDHAASIAKDHRAAEQHHLERMKQLQAKVTALFEAGSRGGEAEKKALVDYYVADAERRLAQIDAGEASRPAPRAANQGSAGGRAPVQPEVVRAPILLGRSAEQLAMKEEKLKQLLEEKSQQLVRELKDIQRMSEALGIVDPSATATQNQMLQVQLSTLNNSIFNLRAQLSNLDVEIEKCTIDIQLAQDPQAKEARAEEEMRKDEKLKKLEDRLSDLELAIEVAEYGKPKGEEVNPELQRLAKQRAVLEDMIRLRRDELLKKFSDSTELVKVKEFEGKKRTLEKQRDSLKEQLASQEASAAETADKLKIISRDTADLEARRRRIRSLEQFVDRLDKELQDTYLERQMASPEGQK